VEGKADQVNHKPKTGIAAPIRFLAVLAFTMFFAELFVMFLLSYLHPGPAPAGQILDFVIHALIDSSLLVLLISPALYFSVYRPIEKSVAERRRAEEALKKSEEKYRSLFVNMLNGYAYCKMIFDENSQPVGWIYLEINDAFEKSTGLKRENNV
jgi:PAS domain-containing protein